MPKAAPRSASPKAVRCLDGQRPGSPVRLETQLTIAQEEADRGSMDQWSKSFEEVRKEQRSRFVQSSTWGISNIIVCPNSGKPQVLSYNIRALITFGGILNMFARGTIFRDQYSLRVYFLVHWGGLVVCVAAVMLGFSDHKDIDTTPIEALQKYLNFLIPLIVGLYVSLSLERWWVLRVDALGRLCDCALDIVQQVAAYLPEEEEVITCCNRWSMAAVTLVMNAAREKYDLRDMVSTGLLKADEVAGLEGIALYGRAMVMWAWIARIGNEAMLKCKGPEPYSNHLFVMLDVCVKARRAIQTIHTYLQTALPFSYVHIVAFLVDAMVAVTTMRCSIVCVKAYHQDPINYQYIIYETVAFVALPLLYHGLMSVTYVIRDPFGDDMADFPISTFQSWEQDHIDAVVTGGKKFPWQEWELLSGLPKSKDNVAAHGKAAEGVKKCRDEFGDAIDEDTEGVNLVAEQAAGAIMKDATIEVTIQIKRALKGVAEELKLLVEAIERTGEARSADTEFLLEKLGASGRAVVPVGGE